MSNTQQVVQKQGLGVASILGIVFVLCKIFGIAPIATWSWLWVLSPFWISIGLSIAVIVIFMVLALIALILAAIFG